MGGLPALLSFLSPCATHCQNLGRDGAGLLPMHTHADMLLGIPGIKYPPIGHLGLVLLGEVSIFSYYRVLMQSPKRRASWQGWRLPS